jgi:hypothetical protein
VAGDASLGHGGQLLGRGRVDDAEVAVTLVGGHQERLYGVSGWRRRFIINRVKGRTRQNAKSIGTRISGFIHGGRIISAKAATAGRKDKLLFHDPQPLTKP